MKVQQMAKKEKEARDISDEDRSDLAVSIDKLR